MLDAVKMKEACRICARELCGNQRRWIFHPAAKLSLQVLLAHALGRGLGRDGRGEFACSKCAFMLERMFRFDTVVARVEALSLERLQRLLLEKERLRLCIAGLYRRSNPGEAGGEDADLDGSYLDLIQDDLVFSGFESWADREDAAPDQPLHHCTGAEAGQKTRRCRGCAALRVADSDYEAVCKVPRRFGRRSTSCGPSTRYSASTLGMEDLSRTSEATPVPMDVPAAEADKRSHSPASSVESLELHRTKEEPNPNPEETCPIWRKPQTGSSLSGAEVLLGILRGWEYRPVTPPRGSKLPVLVKGKLDPSLSSHPAVPEVVVLCPEEELQAELEELEEQWLDDYLQCGPFRLQQQLIGEQQDQLCRYQSAAGRCVGELQQAQNQVRLLQVNIRKSEARNQKLQERLAAMELQLRSAQDEAQQQERLVQNLTDSIVSKETEVSDLSRTLEEQNQALRSLREVADRSQLSGTEAAPGQGEVLALQAALFQAQLELQAAQLAQRRADRAQEDQNQALERLERDLQGALQHRRETERHNRELQLILQTVRSDLQVREEQLSEGEQERQREREERERSVAELRADLQLKEQLLQEYGEMLKEPKENRDSLLQKLRQRIAERDRALERAVDETFRSAEQRDAASRQLQLLLREKERDLERQRRVLANNEETIASLEALLRGKELQLQQLANAWTGAGRQQRDADERTSQILRERDGIIEQLQAALLARTQETQDLCYSLLPQVQSAPGQVLEELKLRLQLKDRLFQEVMSDRTRQAREHQEQVQDLLRTVSARDQYIQDSAARLTEVLEEQTRRVQELRRQLGSRSQPDAAAALQQELQQEQNQEETRSRAEQLEHLSRSLSLKEEIIRDLQRKMVDPSDLPVVERLTLEVQELREVMVRQEAARQPEFGEMSGEDEDEADEDVKSEFTDEDDDDECAARGRQLDAEGLMEVKQLVEQKQVVERELVELKAQLEKAGFSSLSQMRRTLFSLRSENEDLKLQLAGGRQAAEEEEELDVTVEEEEEELDVTVEEEEEELDVTVEEEEESSGTWEAWDGDPSLSDIRTQSHEDQKTEEGDRTETLTGSSQDDEPSNQQRRPDASPSAACGKTVRLQLKSRELQERLMVSEATVQAKAEQLQDYRELLAETAVQQDSKLVQVDLQDLGYETCGRSENEADREEASSPEFDDLEMCTSLDLGSQWWPGGAQPCGYPGDGPSLRRLVEDLRSQLCRSQAVIRGLQGRLRRLSAPGEVGRSPQAEDDEGWRSSDGASQRHHDNGLQELTSRVDALEDQLRKGGRREEGNSANWPGKLDSLLKAQARELSLLRQRLREGRAACGVLRRHLADATRAFEELLRANDVDYYTGQSFREQLAQSAALAQRVGARIAGRDPSEDPEETTELLAVRLSKELQQKDKVIESLQAKLDQQHHHHHHGSDSPSSSHALSDITDQSDRISYVSDEHGSTNGDPELCCDTDAAGGLRPEGNGNATGTASPLGAASRRPSVGSSQRSQSCLSCPSMHCSGSPLRPADLHSQSAPCRPSLPSPIKHGGRSQRSAAPAFSLAAVQQELQTLQKQLRADGRFSTPRSLHGLPRFVPQHHADAAGCPPLSYQGFPPPPPFSLLDVAMATRAGPGPLERGASWDTACGGGADLSSGSSGYQSGTGHTGSDLMKEHLAEIRSLRRRLEESIQTNDRLRLQLEDRLARSAGDKGAPTNIYIQGLDSAGQLSAELRLLQEENAALQAQLQRAGREGSREAELRREAEHLREAVLRERSRLKEAELETQRWAELSQRLQAEDAVRCQEVAQLREDRQRNQETINRLQHEASVLRLQLDHSRSLIQTLQEAPQDAKRRIWENSRDSHSDEVANGALPVTFDPRELHIQLKQQLSTQPAARRRLFSGEDVSPPVRDSGPIRDSGLIAAPPQPSPGQTADPAARAQQGGTPEGGHHAVGHLGDLQALQQQLLDGAALAAQMEAALCSLNASQRLQQPLDRGCVGNLLSDSKTLKRILQEAESLLQATWTADLTDSEEARKDESLRAEVVRLRTKLSEQDQALRDAMERLKSSSLTKDSMEHFIVSQLSRTRDVLSRAKTNLQENKLRICSLPASVSVLSSPSGPVKVKTQGAPLSSAPLLVGAS
ncbi:myomegalin-like isoform X1 [Xiphophorus maculatus]|uniref:myomegalin-like isoform X1 n=1 Tax=Xiphophorus maculatus TaxID=8083 RepID=UPI000C6D2675|nr:myomegalin-like isoform X1 [Xiphophorus maculatus]